MFREKRRTYRQNASSGCCRVYRRGFSKEEEKEEDGEGTEEEEEEKASFHGYRTVYRIPYTVYSIVASSRRFVFIRLNRNNKYG